MTYPIPSEALDDRLGWVGTTGSGKTYNAGVGVEKLLASAARVVIVDPLDVWWGLRSLPDGKTASRFKLPIFGGAHGDLPLTEHSGALIGETVAKMRESCIVSLGGFASAASERRFMLAFLTTLYRHTSGQPVHLVLDEADLWSPQVVMDKDGDAVKLKGQVQTLVRRGRIKGFIPWLITQRPAVIDKSVLSQVDGLVAFKLTSSQDREAIGAWIKGQADEGQGREILASLPTLPRGTGVVWLPGRGVLTTAPFPAKVTYDSSRTPARGEVVKRTELKPLDLGALKERLAAVEAETKANDPKALKAEIAKLRAELAKKPATIAAEPDPAVIKAAVETAYLAGVEEGKKRGHVAGQAVMLARAQSALGDLLVDATPEVMAVGVAHAAPAPRPPRPAPAKTIAAPAAPTGDVPPGCAKPLATLAGVYPAGMTEAQWSIAAGYKRTGGTWGTYKGRLRSAGLIEQKEGRWFATEAGAAAAGDVELPPAPGPELVRWWAAKLPGTRKIAEALIEAWPREMGRDELADAVSMSAGGGSFGTYLGRLASPGLIERNGGAIRLSTEAMGLADG